MTVPFMVMLSGSETSERFFGTFVPQNDRAFYGHVERSETSERFFGTYVPQNDIIERVILRRETTKNLSRHVEKQCLF